MAYRAELWAALGDPTRLAIMERLVDRPLAVVELARQLPISRPAVSQHLKVLKDAGLVIWIRRRYRNISTIPVGTSRYEVQARAWLQGFARYSARDGAQ